MRNENDKPKDLLDWLGVRALPDFAKARWIGAGAGFVLLLMFLLAFVAAGLVMVHTIGQALNAEAEGPNLGAGALIAALLGAPFLIWTTVLKHQTVRYQKEGHMTDRITKAVEQLGAEKTVERIGRPVTVWTGTPERVNYSTEDAVKFIGQTRTQVSTKEWDQTWNHEAEEVEEGYRSTVSIWPSERTIIQWQGETIAVSEDEAIGIESPWQVFKETQPNLEVRIGAILSLERIAQDSTTHDKGRDHVRVMEILCAYVRENSNAHKPVDFPEPDWEPLKDKPTEEEREAHLMAREERFRGFFKLPKAWVWAQTLTGLHADVMQAMLVIGRRTAAQRLVEAAWPDPPGDSTVWPFDLPCPHLPDETGEAALSKAELTAYRHRLDAWKGHVRAYKGYRLDLKGANLQGADLAPKRPDLSDAVFAGALLTNARMEGAKFGQARIEGADLGKARMEGANLRAARMEGADLGKARMEGADLGKARMQGAFLEMARMEGAFLEMARMEGAFLEMAQMEGAFLEAARMEGVNFWRARMEATYLGRAWMNGVDFRQAWMDSSKLRAAKMSGASLCYVDLNGVGIAQEQVNAMFGDASVILPARIIRPTHWPVWKLPFGGEHDFQNECDKWRSDPAGYRPPPPPTPEEDKA